MDMFNKLYTWFQIITPALDIYFSSSLEGPADYQVELSHVESKIQPCIESSEKENIY